MTDTPEIARIRAAQAAGPDVAGLAYSGSSSDYMEGYDAGFSSAAGDAESLLARIDAQAAEIERLRADALRNIPLLTDALKVLKAHQEYGSPTLLTGVMAVNAIKAIEDFMKEQP